MVDGAWVKGIVGGECGVMWWWVYGCTLLISNSVQICIYMYRIAGKFGEHYIWRIGLRRDLANFNLATC